MNEKIILILIVLSILPKVAMCEIYKWTNDDGTIEFTDDSGQVPEKYRDRVEIKKEPINKSDEFVTSNERITNKESLSKDEQAAEDKPSPEETKKAEEEIRDVWEHIKKSLTGK